jgi:hypothetical protein
LNDALKKTIYEALKEDKDTSSKNKDGDKDSDLTTTGTVKNDDSSENETKDTFSGLD